VRIISDFKDYYDCIQAMGQDQSLIYLRNRTVINLVKNRSVTWNFPGFIGPNRESPVGVRQSIVGFCGRIYPVIQLERVNGISDADNLDCPALDIGLTTCFTMDDVNRFHEQHLTEEAFQGYCFRGHRWWHKSGFSGIRQNEFQKFFELCEAGATAPNHTKYFAEYRCPIFVAQRANFEYKTEARLTINSSLKDVEWVRRFDPSMAYQEISMFLGNMASPEKPIPKIDDETMAEAKGFDKYSFRKDPSSKKKK